MSKHAKDENPDEFQINITGEALDQIVDTMDVLEVDSPSPIPQLMVTVFCNVVLRYGMDEKFRLLTLVDPESMKAIRILDLEELRVRAKIIEYGGE